MENSRIYPTFARFRRFRVEDRVFARLEQRQFAVTASKGPSKLVVDGGPIAETRRFACIKAYLSSHCPVHSAGAHHAGAGGARRRAISNRMSANICRGTATSAIWKVT